VAQLAFRVTRRLKKIDQILEKVAKTVANLLEPPI
jgi:ppGpp synthetase/RelA/SpoT-type nucleotidyltranferase